MTPVALAAAFLLHATPTTGATVRTLTVAITDPKGAPVQGVTPEEIALLENGVARPVDRFEADHRPLTVAVIVDSSAPVVNIYRLHVLDALVQFVSRLPEGARYAIWTTGDRPTKIQDFTSDPTHAAEVLRRVVPQGGNMLLDALVEASRDLNKQEAQRSVVVAVTGLGLGFANWDRYQVVELAQRHAAQFAAVQFEDVRAPGEGAGANSSGQVGGTDYEYALTHLTRRTGGLYETLLSAMSVGTALRRVAEDLAHQYRLSYQSVSDKTQPKLEVKVARPSVKVRLSTPRP